MADVVVAGLGEPALVGEEHRLAVDGLVNRPSKMRHWGAGYIALSLCWQSVIETVGGRARSSRRCGRSRSRDQSPMECATRW